MGSETKNDYVDEGQQQFTGLDWTGMEWNGHVRKDVFTIQKWAFRANNTLEFYKALIREVMTYACPTLEIAVDAHLLKLQRQQYSTLLNILTGAHQSVNFTRVSKFLTCTTI
jgi:hypothetical protein